MRIVAPVTYCAGLAGVSAAGLALTLIGRPGAAADLATGWQRRTGAPALPLPGRTLPAAANASVGLLLGLVAVIPLGTLALFVARGVLYGWVDPGPYDTAWGGPTRSGAWAAHFLTGLSLVPASVAALIGLAALHRRWTARLSGARGGAWVLPVVLLICAVAAVLFTGWLRQIGGPK